jgi:hypothetical protein
MLETLGGGILGSVLGGLFRLAPEVMKVFDRKSERSHELSMFDRQCRLEEQRGAQKMAEIGAQRDLQVDTAAMDALKAAVESQADMVQAAGTGFSASLSASVRPMVTYWVLFIWSVLHFWYCLQTVQAGLDPTSAFKTMLTPDFAALVAGTLNYWFLDRTLAKRGL